MLFRSHTEQLWQLVPLFLMGGGSLVLAWCLARRDRTSLRVFRAVMVLFISSGVLGVYLHLRGNVEFELEMRPSLAGSDLAIEALQGAMPALAPGTLLQLGLLGLLVTYRHPALGAATDSRPDS